MENSLNRVRNGCVNLVEVAEFCFPGAFAIDLATFPFWHLFNVVETFNDMPAL